MITVILMSVGMATLAAWVAIVWLRNATLWAALGTTREFAIDEAVKVVFLGREVQRLTYRNEYLWALNQGHTSEDAQTLAEMATQMRFGNGAEGDTTLAAFEGRGNDTE